VNLMYYLFGSLVFVEVCFTFMSDNIIQIQDGCITSSRGFQAGATYAGINKHPPHNMDLALLYSEAPCNACALFTTNRVKAAPVLISRDRLPSSCIQALIVNSGVANACTGEKGMADARFMADLAAARLNLKPECALPMSTGVIGKPLPVDLIAWHLPLISLSNEGGAAFARAIMTTDTRPKEIAVKVKSGGGDYTISGAAKGAGMIAPNMATTLCFITTDAAIELEALETALRKAGNKSFNMITVDGDTSTNDTLLVMANGLARNQVIKTGSRAMRVFQEALDHVCIFLARSVVSDGEGATRLITANVAGARSKKEARIVAKAIASSNLVKTAIHGADPNWGRIVSAAGSSGAAFEESRLSLTIGGIKIWQEGKVLDFELSSLRSKLQQEEIVINLNLNLGKGTATAWGCDMSEEYVTINSEYTT
jgi:glutamate N-acetyltransferase/amino-acid N-acetyltransferase